MPASTEGRVVGMLPTPRSEDRTREEDLEPEPETTRNEMGTIIQCKRWTMCPIGEFTFPLVIRHEVFVFRKQKPLLADIRANTPDKLVGKRPVGRVLTDDTDRAALEI